METADSSAVQQDYADADHDLFFEEVPSFTPYKSSRAKSTGFVPGPNT